MIVGTLVNIGPCNGLSPVRFHSWINDTWILSFDPPIRKKLHSWQFLSNYQSVFSTNCNWKCRLQNDSYLIQTPQCFNPSNACPFICTVPERKCVTKIRVIWDLDLITAHADVLAHNFARAPSQYIFYIETVVNGYSAGHIVKYTFIQVSLVMIIFNFLLVIWPELYSDDVIQNDRRYL